MKFWSRDSDVINLSEVFGLPEKLESLMIEFRRDSIVLRYDYIVTDDGFIEHRNDYKVWRYGEEARLAGVKHLQAMGLDPFKVKRLTLNLNMKEVAFYDIEYYADSEIMTIENFV